MHDDGVIKFHCRHEKKRLAPDKKLIELVKWRNRFRENGMIGVYSDGVGYGNVSCRAVGSSFHISGSQTGSILKATSKHFSTVTSVDLQANTLTCFGEYKASSESLTHAVFYECTNEVQSVLHFHHTELWKSCLGQKVQSDRVRVIPDSVQYGTQSMASAVDKMIHFEFKKIEMIVMEGHEDGLIVFGKDFDELQKKIINVFERYLPEFIYRS